MIPTLRFIPIAEETGLILEIGEWVLRETCRKAAANSGSQHFPQQFRRCNISALIAWGSE